MRKLGVTLALIAASLRSSLRPPRPRRRVRRRDGSSAART